jgi:hypothetical protein
MATEFARLLPERLAPPVTVIGFAATTNRTSCFAIREAHFGFAAAFTWLRSGKKIAGGKYSRVVLM